MLYACCVSSPWHHKAGWSLGLLRSSISAPLHQALTTEQTLALMAGQSSTKISQHQARTCMHQPGMHSSHAEISMLMTTCLMQSQHRGVCEGSPGAPPAVTSCTRLAQHPKVLGASHILLPCWQCKPMHLLFDGL